MKTFTHISYNRLDKNRKLEVPCTNSVRFTRLWSKHSQFREYFILNHKKRFWLEAGIFRYFSFTFYIQYILLAGKYTLEIKRFDEFTLARSSHVFNY